MNTKPQKSSHGRNRSRAARAPDPAARWTRRQFAKRLAWAGAGAALPAVLPGCVSAPHSLVVANSHARKKVALLATVVRKYSHAQHFIDRLLEGYGWEGRHHFPPLEL